jgi:hypothetical protein
VGKKVGKTAGKTAGKKGDNKTGEAADGGDKKPEGNKKIEEGEVAKTGQPLSEVRGTAYRFFLTNSQLRLHRQVISLRPNLLR